MGHGGERPRIIASRAVRGLPARSARIDAIVSTRAVQGQRQVEVRGSNWTYLNQHKRQGLDHGLRETGGKTRLAPCRRLLVEGMKKMPIKS